MNNCQVKEWEYKPGINSEFEDDNTAKERLDGTNLSISGDVNIASGNRVDGHQGDSDLDNYYASSDMMLNALCENDGWEEGYDY